MIIVQNINYDSPDLLFYVVCISGNNTSESLSIIEYYYRNI